MCVCVCVDANVFWPQLIFASWGIVDVCQTRICFRFIITGLCEAVGGSSIAMLKIMKVCCGG